MTAPLQPTVDPTDLLGSPTPPTAAPVVAPPPPPPEPVAFPLGWMLEHAALPLRYRSIRDVAGFDEIARRADWMPLAHPSALALALAQRADGTWGDTMLGPPKAAGRGSAGVGTVTATRRLLEYGWDRESPPIQHARRVLFRLLAEDDDPAFLFEFSSAAGDPDLVMRGRSILREASAAALAQAGYERDPRLRGAAIRILERIADYLRSPLAAKPWVRVGNKQVLAAEAVPPSVYALTMLAHMPLFCAEHWEELDRVYQYVSQPMPRQDPVQLVGEHLVEQPHLVLGDPLPHRNAADADVPTAITWLELMARLNFLRRCDHWQKLFERFLDDRGRDGVWNPHKGTAPPATTNPFVWPLFPLGGAEDDLRADVTFRLGLIARLSGRPIDLV